MNISAAAGPNDGRRRLLHRARVSDWYHIPAIFNVLLEAIVSSRIWM